MKKIKIILTIFIVFLCCWVIGAFVKNSWETPDLSNRKFPEPKNSQANVEMKNVHYSHTNEDAVKEWELNAKSALYFKEKNQVIFNEPVVTFYSKDGKRYTLSGNEGELYTDTQNIKITGNVVGRGLVGPADQGEFRTNSLTYDAKDKKITTGDRVRLQSKQFGVEGTGMVVDTETQKLSLLKDIRAVGKK